MDTTQKDYKQLNIGSISFFIPLADQIAYMLSLKKYVVECKPVHKIAFKTTFKPGITFHKYREDGDKWFIIIRKRI